MEGQAGHGAVIEALIADFQERELPRVTPRDLSLPGLPGKADVVVGMRRSGKTFFLYLETGGFPEVQEISQDLRVRVLQEYVDVVIFRDVVERHGVDNLPALRYLERRLLASPAGKFSVSKLFNDLKSQGMRVGKDTLYEYLAHLEDSFLLSTVAVASPSVRARQVNPRKCYPVDPALAAAVSFRASGDVGHLLETAVYLELRRRGRSLAYVATRSGYEVDFLAEDSRGSRELVQVCAGLEDPATRQRELRALAEGMRETSCEHAVVVTSREEDTVELGGRPVRIVPAWRWLLEPEGGSEP